MDDDLIGENHKELEKKYGFEYYIETKDDFSIGKNVDSKSLVDAFLKFNGETELKVVKLYNGTIQEISVSELKEIRDDLVLLSGKKGKYYDDSDDDLATSYGFLCENYFAEIMEGIIFFYGKKDFVYCFARVLDKFKIEYHKPYNIIKREERIGTKLRKLGRNEPCHCGSSLKYKKCCLKKDLDETGKPKKVNY